jgi:hypothetical protein
VIREYRHARNIIDRELTNRIKVSDATKMASKGKKYGRPPYGYKTEKGRLKVDRPNAEAVSLIFRRIRENKRSLRDILTEIKEAFPLVPGTNDPQFWDNVKLRRIISKARLYCLGEYSSSEGSTITIANLAFLPPEWADTTWPSSKPSDPQE